jgi:hypothetical protein
MTRLRIEPNQKLSELLLKNHKAVFKVKFRYHLHTFEEIKKDEPKKDCKTTRIDNREVDKSE